MSLATLPPPLNGTQNQPDNAVQAILRARAEALARPPAETRQGTCLQLLVLRLGQERYALPVASVIGVESRPPVIPLPGLPAHWRGLINRQGQVIPVLDLARWLDLPAGEEDAGAVVLVQTEAGWPLGLWVDQVEETRTVYPEDLRPPLARQRPALTGSVTGLTSDLVAVLHPSCLLPPESLAVDQRRR